MERSYLLDVTIKKTEPTRQFIWEFEHLRVYCRFEYELQYIHWNHIHMIFTIANISITFIDIFLKFPIHLQWNKNLLNQSNCWISLDILHLFHNVWKFARIFWIFFLIQFSQPCETCMQTCHCQFLVSLAPNQLHSKSRLFNQGKCNQATTQCRISMWRKFSWKISAVKFIVDFICGSAIKENNLPFCLMWVEELNCVVRSAIKRMIAVDEFIEHFIFWLCKWLIFYLYAALNCRVLIILI